MHRLNSVSPIQTRCYEARPYTDYSAERCVNSAHSPGKLALGPLGRAGKDDVMMGLYMEICWRCCWMRVWLGQSTSHGPARKPLRPLLHKLRSSHASLLSASQRLYHKTSTFCHGSVNSYTGYINVKARHPFFYFFQSRRDPCKDDVIFWTNGGPGCSQPWACSWSWVRAGLSGQSWNEIILSVSGFRTRSTGSGFLVMLVSTNSICPDLTAYVSVEWIQLTLVPFVA